MIAVLVTEPFMKVTEPVFPNTDVNKTVKPIIGKIIAKGMISICPNNIIGGIVISK